MIVLGIETSCDETSVAILKDDDIMVNLISSQLLHQEYGGVVPEFASREHMRLLPCLTQKALDQISISLNNIDAIAVTKGPGLMGALLVGLSFGKGLSYALNIPFLAVNHIEGHIMANFLSRDSGLNFPFLCLIVSGGHTQIVNVKDFGDYDILGRSVDDAAGEAFDKAARILNLGYPGGPAIDEFSKNGDPTFHYFPRAKVKRSRADFSFSGLKTSMLYLVKQKGQEWVQGNLPDLCASYQEAIVDMLRTNTFLMAKEKNISTLVIAGGVAANSRLRRVFSKEAKNLGIRIFFPSPEYCTDNAAMIARTGLEMIKHKISSSLNVSAVPNLPLN